MTIVAAVVDPERYVMMMADGVSTIPENGNVGGYVSKLTLLPGMNLMIGASGTSELPLLMQYQMPLYVKAFDDLVDIFPDFLEFVVRTFEHETSRKIHKSCVVIGGWSDKREEYEIWRVVTYQKPGVFNSSGEEVMLKPYTIYKLNPHSVWASSAPPRDILERFGAHIQHEGETAAQTLFRTGCAARANSSLEGEEGIPFNAGGYIQLASLQQNFLQSSIPYRWPEDVIGEPIDPGRGEAMPQHILDALGG